MSYLILHKVTMVSMKTPMTSHIQCKAEETMMIRMLVNTCPILGGEGPRPQPSEHCPHIAWACIQENHLDTLIFGPLTNCRPHARTPSGSAPSSPAANVHDRAVKAAHLVQHHIWPEPQQKAIVSIQELPNVCSRVLKILAECSSLPGPIGDVEHEEGVQFR
jgi:hypothetical protein